MQVKQYLLAYAFSLLIALTGIHTAEAQTSPEAVLKTFYNSYVDLISKNVDPIKGRRTPLRKYVTARLLQLVPRIEKESGSDYFLQSQEWDDNWVNKIIVSPAAIKGSVATALVTFPGGYPRVRVTLLRQAGRWKIDSVKNMPQG